MRYLVGLLLLTFASALAAQDSRPAGPPESDGAVSDAVTLEFWNREIATFRTDLAGLTPAERREATLNRMRGLPDFALYKKVTRETVAAGDFEATAFEIDGHRLFVLVPADLDPTAEVDFEEHTAEVLGRLEGLRQAWLDQRSVGVILRGAAFAGAAASALALFLFLLLLVALLLLRIFTRQAARLRKLKRRDLDLRPVLLQLIRRGVGLMVTLLGLAAGYLWITHVLGLFPYTAPWSDTLGSHLSSLFQTLLSGFLAALPGLAVVVLIFFATRGTVRLVDQVLASYERSDDDNEVLGKDTARATRRIAGLVIWIAGVIIAYPYIPGSDSPAFKGIGVLLGLMVSIGSSGFVNQLMSGFIVLYSRAVRSGEYVAIGDIEGTVVDIDLLSTKILTPKREYVSIPNAVLISKETRNFTRRHTAETELCELSTSVTIGYDAPWRKVHELLLEAADRTPGIRDTPAPRVLQTALSDFYAEYELRFVPAAPEAKGKTLSDLHQRIQDAFHEAGVQIMSPNFVAQPAEPVLPPPATKGG